jgi:hypothetical protein
MADKPGPVYEPRTARAQAAKAAKKVVAVAQDAKPLKVDSPVSTLTGSKTVHTPAGDVTLNVRALQNQLIRAGYKIGKADGQLGSVTLSALRDYLQPGPGHQLGAGLSTALKGGAITGARDPKAWNQRFGTNKLTPMRPTTGHPGDNSLDSAGNDITNQYAPPSQDVNLDPQKAMADNLGTPISEQIANYGTLLDPKMADAIAGQQFDPQIREAQFQLAKDPIQGKQNLTDIGSWYQQVLDSQKTAAGRDTAASHAGVASITDAAKALAASFGGSANMGASNIAETAQNGIDTQTALGTVQDQYNNDLRPILQNEKAGMLTNQTNKDQNLTRADQLALENFQGQRGQALTAAQLQIRDANNSLSGNRANMLVGIKGSNNALAQQGFTNSLALAQAQIAAMMSGLQIQTAQAKATKAIAPNAFMNASPTTKNNAFQQAMGALTDRATNQWIPHLTPEQARGRVAAVVSSFGWNPMSPQVAPFVQNVVSQYGQ